ncbi:NAD(P)-binding protein [Ramaria rubella]|nr:NAD(P)-binding protein [Ramaria rubella]
MFTWLVTGASRGIGLELVHQIVAGGDTVFATARSPDSASDLQQLAASSPGGRIHVVQLDVADAESIKTAAGKVEELLEGRGLDYLLNNAGKGCGDIPPSIMDMDVFMDAMRSNVVGPALVFQAFLPALERSKRPEGPVILNTTSGLASIGLDIGGKATNYSITKCALNMLTYKQSKEKSNMIFFVMDPGWVKTALGGEGAQLEIPFSVSHQYKQIVSATRKDSGTFKRYNGEIIPW